MNNLQKTFSSVDEIFSSQSLHVAMRSRLPWSGRLADEGVDRIFSWDLLDEFLFFHRVQNDRLRLSFHHDFAGPNWIWKYPKKACVLSYRNSWALGF